MTKELLVIVLLAICISVVPTEGVRGKKIKIPDFKVNSKRAPNNIDKVNKN
jgi:hypothetical protein